MADIKFGSQRIEFERLDSKSKDIITIRIHPNKEISILAPIDLTDGELTKIVKTKTPWIIEKFQRIDEINETDNKHEFVSGEGFLYKGKTLRLKVLSSQSKEGVHTDTTTLFCKTKRDDRVKYLLLKWYKNIAKQYLENRVDHLSKKFSKKPLKIGIRNQYSRWGSCTGRGDVLLNWRIIMAPVSVIDYVIIHELAHLQEKNHSDRFWSLVRDAMPDYEEKREWLRRNGPKIQL